MTTARTSIQEGFRKALEKVNDQLEKEDAVNAEDVKQLAVWKSLLEASHQAKRVKEAQKVN